MATTGLSSLQQGRQSLERETLRYHNTNISAQQQQGYRLGAAAPVDSGYPRQTLGPACALQGPGSHGSGTSRGGQELLPAPRLFSHFKRTQKPRKEGSLLLTQLATWERKVKGQRAVGYSPMKSG